MNCLLCDTETQSLRRNTPCCRDCRADFDTYRKKYKGAMMDILTGKMSVDDFELEFGKETDMADVNDTSEIEEV